MRVLFVYSLRDVLSPRQPLASFGNIHIGVSYLSSFLKAQGHETKLVVLSSESGARGFEILERAIVEFEPQLVAFTAVSTQYPFVRELARKLKAGRPSLYLVIGGVHATLAPEQVARDRLDAVCVGEGEEPLVELTGQLAAGRQPRGIRNLWIRQPDGSLEKNPTRDFAAELGKFPFPDRDVWQEWVKEPQAGKQVLLPSRGCPYVCTYCSNHALRKVAGGKYVRLRPVNDVLAELKFLKEKFPETAEVYLQSETIAISLPWLSELGERIHEFNASLDRPISFTCNFRVARAFLSDRVFECLQHANVQAVEIGLESGSERLRCDVLRRHYSNEDFRKSVRLARDHGMRVHVYNMIGLPGETREDYLQTVEINREVVPDQIMTSIFHPYPGTDLYETCKTRGLLPPENHMTTERYRAAIDFPEFSRREIQRAFEWFDYRIYKGRRPWHYRLRRTLRNKAYAQPWAHSIFLRLLPLWHAWRKR